MLTLSTNNRAIISFKAGEYDKDFPKYLNQAKKNRAHGQSFVRLIGLDRFSNTTQQHEAIELAAKEMEGTMWKDRLHYIKEAAQEMGKRIAAMVTK